MTSGLCSKGRPQFPAATAGGCWLVQSCLRQVVDGNDKQDWLLWWGIFQFWLCGLWNDQICFFCTFYDPLPRSMWQLCVPGFSEKLARAGLKSEAIHSLWIHEVLHSLLSRLNSLWAKLEQHGERRCCVRPSGLWDPVSWIATYPGSSSASSPFGPTTTLKNNRR